MRVSHDSISRLAGTALLLSLIALRVVSWANLDQVWLFGRQLHWGCWFKDHFGLPCPSCGMTRSVILSLHGDLTNAFTLNPAGPFLIAGFLLIVIVLLRLPLIGPRELRTRQVVLGLSFYGWIFVTVMLGQWALRLP